MKYVLAIMVNQETLDSLSPEEREALGDNHQRFMQSIRDSGEFVNTVALAFPASSKTVRVRDGAPAVTDGPYQEAKEFFGGYYIIDCESEERALELAGQIPDAKLTGIEVRPIMYEAGMEM